MAGFDTTGTIQAVRAAGGLPAGQPLFWVRYFTPSPTASVFNDDPIPESQAAWDSGAPNIGAVMSPGDLSSSSAQGLADAQAFAAALLSAWLSDGPLELPTNGILYCWLDQEPGAPLNTGYWNSWATYIDEYNFAGSDTFPLFPGLYTNPLPSNPTNGCSVVTNTNNTLAWAIWTAQPEPLASAGGCSLASPPPFEADPCPVPADNDLTNPALLWQYGEQGVTCFNYAGDVDLDVAAPGIYYPSYCFYLAFRPL
jgi:hypothetical protein